MKKYTITNQSVKTIYSIQITADNLGEIFRDLRKNNPDQLRSNTLLAKYNLAEIEPGLPACQKLLEEIWSPAGSRANTDTIRVVVRSMGFDGIENFGYCASADGIVRLLVYRHGDCINI